MQCTLFSILPDTTLYLEMQILPCHPDPLMSHNHGLKGQILSGTEGSSCCRKPPRTTLAKLPDCSLAFSSRHGWLGHALGCNWGDHFQGSFLESDPHELP